MTPQASGEASPRDMRRMVRNPPRQYLGCQFESDSQAVDTRRKEPDSWDMGLEGIRLLLTSMEITNPMAPSFS
jgi:hypothetical protein